MEIYIPNRTTVTLLRSDHLSASNLSTHYDAAIPFAQIPAPLSVVSERPGNVNLVCPLTGSKFHLFRSPSWLSNFARVDIPLGSQTFTCNEQVIMSKRFDPKSQTYKKIMRATDPVVMKREGGTAQSCFKTDIRNATLGMWVKYKNPRFRDYLLNTGNAILVEGTRNTVWGIGRDIIHDPPECWTRRLSWKTRFGVGALGILSMIIREDIRNGHAEPSWSVIEALLFPQTEQSFAEVPPKPLPLSPPTQSPPTYAEVAKSHQNRPPGKPTPTGMVTPLLSVVFAPEKLAQLKIRYQWLFHPSNPMRRPTVPTRRKYAVHLTLPQLTQFWSVFPEWIPSLNRCPLVNPQSFLVMPQHVYH